jgi:hypothetical protein
MQMHSSMAHLSLDLPLQEVEHRSLGDQRTPALGCDEVLQIRNHPTLLGAFANTVGKSGASAPGLVRLSSATRFTLPETCSAWDRMPVLWTLSQQSSPTCPAWTLSSEKAACRAASRACACTVYAWHVMNLPLSRWNMLTLQQCGRMPALQSDMLILPHRSRAAMARQRADSTADAV